MAPPQAARPGARAGFTLAEVAVTIAIVAIALTLIVQGLNTSVMTAAHTRNYKLARELALLTLGRAEAGLLEDELASGGVYTYAQEGYEAFTWEIVLGDDEFPNTQDDERGAFDSWAHVDDLRDDDEDDDEEAEQPWEKVKIRVTFPKITDFTNELLLERWVPWEQIHPEEEDE